MKKLKNFLAKENSVVLLGNLAASGIGLLVFMLLARILNKEAFGSWAIFTSAVGLVDLMRTGLIRQALVRQLSITSCKRQKEQILASALALNIATSGLLGFAIWVLSLTYTHFFFTYYPILLIASSIFQFDIWKSHAEGAFLRMNGLRVGLNGLFLLCLIPLYWLQTDLITVLQVLVTINLVTSLFSLFTSIRKIRLNRFSKSQLSHLLTFGKHSLLTLSGANLLKSADNLLIGLLMGSQAAAIYAVPLKILDLVEIPLRGFTMTAFRKLCRYFDQGDILRYNQHLNHEIKRLSLFAIMIVGVLALFPDWVIGVLGGEGFEDSLIVLYVFLVPIFLLPLDKFSGIALDAAKRPDHNSRKVWCMVLVNMVGDWLAIEFIGELWAVAAITSLNLITGVVYAVRVNPHFRLRLGSPINFELSHF